MQINWSLILNAVLLVGVIVAIVHVLRMRRIASQITARSPSLGRADIPHDEIISVRRVNDEPFVARPVLQTNIKEDISPIAPLVPNPSRKKSPIVEASAIVKSNTIVTRLSSECLGTSDKPTVSLPIDSCHAHDADSIIDASLSSTPLIFDNEVIEEVETKNINDQAPIMMFLLAKANRHLAGYELLQSVLAAGFRFGEGNLFHRHQNANGHGPIMCSLAAATDKGVFDLQNIGAFTVRGLCLYMHASGNSSIDDERFDIMLDTAKTLSEDLDAYLLDDQRKPLSDKSINRYYKMLNLLEEKSVI